MIQNQPIPFGRQRWGYAITVIDLTCDPAFRGAAVKALETWEYKPV
jgi:hypothetical protein